MTNEEMIAQFYNGDYAMIEKLYSENLGFIHSIAKESAKAFNCLQQKENRPEELTVYSKEILDDLDSEGTLAFFECIKSQKYDASKGKLTTFLYPHIKGAMYRWLEKNVGAVSLSKNKMKTIRKAQRMYNEEYKEPYEIAKILNITENLAEEYINYNTHSLTFSELTPDNADNFIDSLLSGETSASMDKLVQQKLAIESLEEQFRKLSAQDKFILGHSLGVFGYEKQKLNEIALIEMMTVDGIIKARKSIIKKLIKQPVGYTYPGR